MGRRDHYRVYVIELSSDVLDEGRFRKANPGYITGKPCLYVGMTGLDPDVRFDKHKAGIQSNRFAQPDTECGRHEPEPGSRRTVHIAKPNPGPYLTAHAQPALGLHVHIADRRLLEVEINEQLAAQFAVAPAHRHAALI